VCGVDYYLIGIDMHTYLGEWVLKLGADCIVSLVGIVWGMDRLWYQASTDRSTEQARHSKERVAVVLL